ncbi:MAG: hypothetical protein COA49_00845 [Bacteroidetes bacterium]|nr:MAG: hypothetical protein COA49_00845 [Bacteroidota bacterium]
MNKLYLILLLVVTPSLSKLYSQVITFNEITPLFSVNNEDPEIIEYLELGSIHSVHALPIPFPGLYFLTVGQNYNPNTHSFETYGMGHYYFGQPNYRLLYNDSTLNHQTKFMKGGGNTSQRDHLNKSIVLFHEEDLTLTDPYFPKESVLVLGYNGVVLEKLVYDSVFTDHMGLDIMKNINDDPTYHISGIYCDAPITSGVECEGAMWKIDDTGHILWTQTYLDTYEGRAIEPSVDDGFWLSMYTHIVSNGGDVAIIKADANGNEVGRILFGGLGDFDEALATEFGGEIVVIASLNSSEIDGQRTLLTTTIQELGNGELIEIGPRKEYFQGDEVDHHGFIVDDERLLIFGSAPEISGEESKLCGFLMKLDLNRDVLWSRKYSYYDENIVGHPNNSETKHEFFSGVKSNYEGYLLGGRALIINEGYDPWIVKVDGFGCLEPDCQLFDGVEEYIIGLESVMTVFPNPASKVCSIDFNFPENFSVPEGSTLQLYNMAGLKVSELSGPRVRDSKISISLENLSSGNYVLAWISGSKLLDSVQVTIVK